MIIIRNNSTDPAFNLACEEYMLKRANEPVFMLWRNARAVIVGVNQNTAAEIDREYCEENGIKVVRRLTGGGAVFHDLGNVNYTYIEENNANKFTDYAAFTKDIIDYLETLGVTAVLSGRNDCLIDGKKIMGNAQCVKYGKIMHHGCILYSADLSVLSNALKVNRAKIESKGIKSVSSRVINIADCMREKRDVETFIKGLESFMIKRYNCEVRELSKSEKEEISRLSEEKYNAFEWNFGASPEYSYEKSEKYSFGIVSVHFNVKDGFITDIKIYGDFFGQEEISGLEEILKGVKHDKAALESALAGARVDLFIKGCQAPDLIKLFI